MPLLRRAAPPLERAAALERVREVLPPVAAGWALPPPGPVLPGPVLSGPVLLGERPAGGTLPDRDASAADEPGPPDTSEGDGRWAQPVPAERRRGRHAASEAAGPPVGRAGPEGQEAVPPLWRRLRAGRLDPGRRAALGLGLVGLLASLVAGLLVLRSAPREVVVPVVAQAGRALDGGAAATPAAGATSEVVVAVAGRVRRPGLVRLPAGSRVDDAVRAAGGPLPGVDLGLLNLARKVVDGEQVLVGVGPAPGAAVPGAGPAGAPAAGLVNLNTATVADLDALPGIGPVLAQRIVDQRTQKGPFRSVDQLREVSGIGEAKYASLRDAVTV